MINSLSQIVRKQPRLQKRLFLLSALLLVLPPIFYYQSLHPVFPEGLPQQTIGEFTITPMPFDNDAPYQHDGIYVKDFLLMFNKGEISNIRQAYLNIGEHPLLLNELATQRVSHLRTRHTARHPTRATRSCHRLPANKTQPQTLAHH